MKGYKIWDPAFESRVKVILGDIALPHLGLEREKYAALCEGMDAIYHSAATVDWVRPYGALRKANVLGTLDLLRIACSDKPKPFHFVSTAAVCCSTWGPREVISTASTWGTLIVSALQRRSCFRLANAVFLLPFIVPRC